MKNFLISVALLVMPVLASAQIVAPRAVTDVELTFKSTMTCVSLAVSSAANVNAPTQVIASTQTLWGSISIQNRDSTANIYCSDSVAVTSQTAAGTLNTATGWEIPAGSPGGASSFYIGPGQLWYCVNDTITRTSNISLCKGR